MPVAPIAGQTGRFDRKNRSRTTGTDRDEQALEALAGNTATGATEIVIDDDHIPPSENFGTCPQRVLTSPALGIVDQLVCRRLSDVHVTQHVPGGRL